MHAILSIITAATLFIHALFGCCWHHAHSCVRCEMASAEASPVAGGCKCHHGSQPDQQPSGPCNCQFECKGVCTYLPPQKTVADCPELGVPFSSVAIVSVLADRHLSAVGVWEQTCGQLATEPPLRLHLLHQILLI